MAFGIILLLDAEASASLIAYSSEIGSLSSPYMTLGQEAPPHITLLHTRCNRDQAGLWWQSVSSSIGPTLTSHLTGLIFESIPVGDTYVSAGGVSAGVEIIRNTSLDDAHREVIKAAIDVQAQPMGAFGDKFRPHITLSVMRSFPKGSIPFHKDLVSGQLEGTLALGALGAYGTFPEIVHRL